MSSMLLYLIAFLFSATPFFEATIMIPIGILSGLNAWGVIILSVTGNIVTFLLAVVLAEQLKKWWDKRRTDKNKRSGEKLEKAAELWNKYGLPGLAIIHSVTIGSSHVTALIALSLGASKTATALWVGGSIIIWAIAFSILSFLGADFIYSQIDSDGLLNNWFDLN